MELGSLWSSKNYAFSGLWNSTGNYISRLDCDYMKKLAITKRRFLEEAADFLCHAGVSIGVEQLGLQSEAHFGSVRTRPYCNSMAANLPSSRLSCLEACRIRLYLRPWPPTCFPSKTAIET